MSKTNKYSPEVRERWFKKKCITPQREVLHTRVVAVLLKTNSFEE